MPRLVRELSQVSFFRAAKGFNQLFIVICLLSLCIVIFQLLDPGKLHGLPSENFKRQKNLEDTGNNLCCFIS